MIKDIVLIQSNSENNVSSIYMKANNEAYILKSVSSIENVNLAFAYTNIVK